MKPLKIEAEYRGNSVRIKSIHGGEPGADHFYRPKAIVRGGNMTIIASYEEHPWLQQIETGGSIVPGTEMPLEIYEKLCDLVEQCVTAYKEHKESFNFKVVGDTINVKVTVSKDGYRVDFDIPRVHVGTRLYMSTPTNVIQVEGQHFRVAGSSFDSEYVHSGSVFPDKAGFRRWKAAVLNAVRETELDQVHMRFSEEHHFVHLKCTLEAHGIIQDGNRVLRVSTRFEGEASYVENMDYADYYLMKKGLTQRDAAAQCVDVSRVFE